MSDNEWQRVTRDDNNWRVVKQMITSYNETINDPCWIKFRSKVFSLKIQNTLCKIYVLEIKIAFKILTCCESLT